MEKIPLLVLFGPTASGKTALAVELCKRFHGEVVTADSMQVYQKMDIGTAKPTLKEREGIAHHMIDVVPPDAPYSLADYVQQAKKVIEQISSRGKLPVLAGGTGLYIDTLLDNVQLGQAQADPEYREQLWQLAQQQGNEAVYELLQQRDPQTAQTVHANNVKRVIRALEIYHVTGIPQSEHIKRSRTEPSPYNAVKFCIQAERQTLYQRIEARVDLMIQNGLVEEVEQLKKMGLDESYTSMQGIGYKEILWYLQGKMSLEEAVDQIKQSTRRYAKRQITWFKREKDTISVEMEEKKKLEIFQKAMEIHAIV